VAKYGNFVYSSAKYGEAPRLAYSVEPMNITVLNFNTVYVDWKSPTGTFTKIKLVRNQNGYPETPEDGIIVWEQKSFDGSSLQGLLERLSYKDGEETPFASVPIVGGSQVYYSMFLFTSEKIWVLAGKITDTVPSNHDSSRKLIDLLPKVFTTKEQSPLAVVDATSSLHYFLEGLSLTLDQSLTFLELLRPQSSWEKSPSSLIPLQVQTLGLQSEPNIPIKNQKKLVREALYMYSHKGTHSGLQTYIEALTNYSPDINISSNTLLSVQDSTFYGSTGNWVATNGTISSSTEQLPSTGSTVIDTTNTCKIVASTGFTMLLGNDSPITKGSPVVGGETYVVSMQIKSPTSDGDMAINIGWFDSNGTFISATSAGTTSANNTWKSVVSTGVAPANAVYAGLDISAATAGTYYVDQVCLQLGSSASYEEARAIKIVLNPSKTNLISNPSFEVDYAGWTITGSPTITYDANVNLDSYASVQSLKVVNTAPYSISSSNMAANTFGISVDQYYTASVYLQAPHAITMTIYAAAADGTTLASKSVAIGNNNTWQRYSVSLLIDETLTTLDHLYVKFESSVSQTAYYDCVQVEKGPNATEYIDGNMPSNYGVVWAGTANESASYLYSDKTFKIPRLAETLVDWVPSNAFWTLSTLVGLEYNNLTV
jgi:phage tail-like protein